MKRHPFRFESRAGAPDRCEQCDDEKERPSDRYCDRCEGNGWFTRTSERFENGEGVCCMGTWRGIEWGREFHPLNWGVGIEVRGIPDDWAVLAQLGPWSVYVKREWL